MRKQRNELVVLPTAGSDWDFSPWRPDRAASLRATRACEYALEHDCDVACGGGYKNYLDYSLAERLTADCLACYPEIKDHIVVVDGRTNATVPDIMGILEPRDDDTDCRGYHMYHFPSYKRHYDRVQRVFNPYLTNWLDSGEAAFFSKKERLITAVLDSALVLYSCLDPRWEWPITSPFLLRRGGRAAQEEFNRTKEWAEWNPKHDLQERARVDALLAPVAHRILR